MQHLKYEQLIKLAYAKLGMLPKNGQLKIVNDILVEFLDCKVSNVILSAPTGIGKSIIGAIVSECLNQHNNSRTLMLMQSNVLVDQYESSFSKYSQDDFMTIKGTDNYICEYLTKMSNIEAKASSCMIKKANDNIKENFCRKCAYLESREQAKTSKNLITNYAMFFVQKILTRSETYDRALTIYDEAHTFNDAFCNYMTIEASALSIQKIFNQINKDCKNQKDLTYLSIKMLYGNISNAISNGKIDESNITVLLTSLNDFYGSCAEFYKQMSAYAADISDEIEYNNERAKYLRLKSRIVDFFQYKFENVIDVNIDEKSISIKPVFMFDFFEKNLASKYNLFMSATITEKMMKDTLKLQNKTSFIKIPPVYPKEAKSILFYNTRNINFASLKDNSTIESIVTDIGNIIKNHSSMNESGIILVPSYKMIDDIKLGLRRLKLPVKIFIHTKDNKLTDVIDAFKDYQKPAVLLSPAIFEGIDFSDDTSRYQIIIKAPYPSLGDKRMKLIANKYQDVYRTITMMKIVQGIGRSVRNAEDWCMTYILDTNIKNLYYSPINIWRDEFDVV